MAMEDSISTQFVIVPKTEINPHDFDFINCYDQDPFYLNESQIPQMDNAALPFSSPCDYVVLDEKHVNTMVEDPFDYNIFNGSLTSDLDEVSRMIQWGLQSWTKHEEDGNKTIICNGINENYKKCAALEFAEIQKYFELPISEAAKELKVGVTVLKRRCREINIMRWPHRKIKSLKALIEHVKGMRLTNEVRMLEEQKRLLKELPDTELTDRAKKLRQACFRAKNKMKKRSLISAPCP